MDLLAAYGSSSDEDGPPPTDAALVHLAPDATAGAHPPLPTLPHQGHEGRTRMPPHMLGNYPSHVFVPVVEVAAMPGFKALARRATAATWGSASGKRRRHRRFPAEKLHVSLSHTFVLREHHIETFASKLRDTMAERACFWATATGHRTFRNADGSRVFAALEVLDDPQDREMRGLIGAVDEVLRRFKQAPYFDEPQLHISVAWARGNDEQEEGREGGGAGGGSAGGGDGGGAGGARGGGGDSERGGSNRRGGKKRRRASSSPAGESGETGVHADGNEDRSSSDSSSDSSSSSSSSDDDDDGKSGEGRSGGPGKGCQAVRSPILPFHVSFHVSSVSCTIGNKRFDCALQCKC